MSRSLNRCSLGSIGRSLVFGGDHRSPNFRPGWVVAARILSGHSTTMQSSMEADVSTPAAPAVRSRFRRERRCGLAPLFWQHILSSGEVHLDMTTRLTIASSPTRQVPLGSGDSTVIGYQGEVAARLRGAHRGAALSTSKEVGPVFPPRATSAQRLRPRAPSPEPRMLDLECCADRRGDAGGDIGDQWMLHRRRQLVTRGGRRSLYVDKWDNLRSLGTSCHNGGTGRAAGTL